jgi:hypothetical protein
MAQGHRALALKSWAAALTLVPYAWPALQNICRLEEQNPVCDPENILKVKTSAEGIYRRQ